MVSSLGILCFFKKKSVTGIKTFNKHLWMVRLLKFLKNLKCINISVVHSREPRSYIKIRIRTSFSHRPEGVYGSYLFLRKVITYFFSGIAWGRVKKSWMWKSMNVPYDSYFQSPQPRGTADKYGYNNHIRGPAFSSWCHVVSEITLRCFWIGKMLLSLPILAQVPSYL